MPTIAGVVVFVSGIVLTLSGYPEGSVCVCSVFLMAFGDVEKWRGKIGGIHYY